MLSLQKYQYFILISTIALQACTSSSRYKINNDHGPSDPIDVSGIENATPKAEPRSRYGNPKNYKVLGKWYSVRESSAGYKEKGLASWYGNKFHGHRTSSGETYNMYAMTAAHKSLPLPTYVRVTHLQNSRSVIVKVNDRGPFHEGRIIDLSYSAAKKLGITATGTAAVEVEAIEAETFNSKQPYKPKFTNSSAFATYPLKSQSKLFLQVGAFSNQDNAKKLQKRLSRMFKQQQIHSDFNSQQSIYRVRIGPLAKPSDAEKLSVYLNKKGISTTKVTVD